MYFPGDPLFALDPIYQSILDPRARERLVATYDHDLSQPEWATGLPLGHRAHRLCPHAGGGGRMTATHDLTPTPGQTVGPFFAYALVYDGCSDLVPADHPDAVRLHGRVLDGAGDAVPDAIVELWQAGPDGEPVAEAGSFQRDGSTFTGWGRAPTDDEGRYSFTTLTPGPSAGAPAFFALTVFARGLMHRLHTRAYLPLDGAAPDALLAGLGDRAATLVTRQDERWVCLRHPAPGRGRDRVPRPPGARARD